MKTKTKTQQTQPQRAVTARDVLSASYLIPTQSRVTTWRTAPTAYRVNPDGSVSFGDRFSAYDVS